MALSLNTQVDELCRLADKIIENPSLKPQYTVEDTSFHFDEGTIGIVREWGITKCITDSSLGEFDFDSTEGAIGGSGGGAVAGFICGGPVGALVGALLGGSVGYLWGSNNEKEAELKREREKRAMLEKLIAKQQAVINKLNDQSYKNRQEIENLKEMIAILNAVIEKLKHK